MVQYSRMTTAPDFNTSVSGMDGMPRHRPQPIAIHKSAACFIRAVVVDGSIDSRASMIDD